MPSSHERWNELAALMDLGLAFGPGTHLWCLRSREEICYDWLHFKGRQINASFRDFALELYAEEKGACRPAREPLELRRPVAVVLKAYRIEKATSLPRRLGPAIRSAWTITGPRRRPTAPRRRCRRRP